MSVANKQSRKILFVTGTRADYGKIRGLMKSIEVSPEYELHVLVTGMHMLKKYGSTYNEVLSDGFNNCYLISNQYLGEEMSLALANTINILSRLVVEIEPSMIVVHGDRLEALAGATVGTLGSILVCHIEGGERSGTVDEMLRHATSKLSHIHLVANKSSRNRLIQMGEEPDTIHVIGSPDLDVMISKDLPDLNTTLSHYGINFETYSLALFHPVTTERMHTSGQVMQFVKAMEESGDNFIVIYPNNDIGSEEIITAYERLKENIKFVVFPSIRFEYFLTLLKNSRYIIGNSSAGIREAPFYGVPSIDIGTRQHSRAISESIVHVGYKSSEILEGIEIAKKLPKQSISYDYGQGESVKAFTNLLNSGAFWKLGIQKHFRDLK